MMGRVETLLLDLHDLRPAQGEEATYAPPGDEQGGRRPGLAQPSTSFIIHTAHYMAQQDVRHSVCVGDASTERFVREN